MTSPLMPPASSAASERRTHCSMFSASLRHGITTETSTAAAAAAGSPSAAGVLGIEAMWGRAM